MTEIKKDRSYKIEDPKNIGEVIVSWIITHACQEKCGYCISPCQTTELRSEKDHFAIQDKLIQDGLTKNRYIGGEPLIIPHIHKLIADAYSRGVNTRLSTNGILLTQENFNRMKRYLNSVAFPFESIKDNLNAQIRGITGKTHRETILSRIKMAKDYGEMGVLINTCVHKENIDQLEELGAILNENGVDHWKLRRFNSSSGRGAVPNKGRFDISDADFLQKVIILQKLYPNLKIDGRMPSKLESRLMVSPQGNLYRMVGSDDKHIHYGNILRDRLNIKQIAQRDRCD